MYAEQLPEQVGPVWWVKTSSYTGVLSGRRLTRFDYETDRCSHLSVNLHIYEFGYEYDVVPILD